MLLFLIFTYFHPGWADFNDNRLDTRQEVLIRDSIIKPTIDCNHKRCYVTEGLWLCPYTNKLFTNPKDLDIDHVVPLKEAYRSGANRWTKREFIEFTNDQFNLLPVDKRANRAKGDKEPSLWPNKSVQQADPVFWCGTYRELYMEVKDKWRLQIDKKDRCLSYNSE